MASREDKIAAARQKLQRFKSHRHRSTRNNLNPNIQSRDILRPEDSASLASESSSPMEHQALNRNETTVPSDHAPEEVESTQIINDTVDISQPNFIEVTESQSSMISQLKNDLDSQSHSLAVLSEEKQELLNLLASAKKSETDYVQQIQTLVTYINTYRQSMSEIEKRLANETQYKEQLEDQIQKLLESNASLSKDIESNKITLDDSSEIIGELQNKLLQKSALIANLEFELSEEKKRSELMQLKVSHLENSESQHSIEHNTVVERLSFEKQQLTISLTQTRELLMQERDDIEKIRKELSNQKNLNAQSQQSLKTDLKQAKSEFSEQQKLLVDKELEIKALQSSLGELRNKNVDIVDYKDIKNNLETVTKQKQDALLEICKLKENNEILSCKYNTVVQELSSVNEEVKLLRKECSDRNNLLESVQNDKATISRALSQNKELKDQLFEIQERFVELSNNAMDTESKLRYEQSCLESKKHQVTSLENLKTEMSQQLIFVKNEKTQLEERLLKLEEQLVHCAKQNVIQNEVSIQTDEATEFDEKFAAVVEQNESLVSSVKALQSACKEAESNVQDLQKMLDTKAHNISELNAIITEIHKENTEQVSKICSLEEELKIAEEKIEKFDNEMASANAKEIEVSGDWQIVDEKGSVKTEASSIDDVKESTVVDNLEPWSSNSDEESPSATDQYMRSDDIRKLQKRLSTIVEEKIQLSHRVEELEKINTYLSGENETIGDYIHIYHAQRKTLQKREAARSQFFSSVIEQGQLLRKQSIQLGTLIKQLIADQNNPNHSAMNIEERRTVGEIMQLLSQINGQNVNSPDTSPCTFCRGCTGRLQVV